ncbi:site-specific integrase [Comamonas sp. CMM01]|nr:site-specific integrase [Comamonas sp. CMM01]
MQSIDERAQFVAKRIRFQNGERHSVLSRVGGLPVHEAALFLARFRTRGRSANTIHFVCVTLSLVHRWLQTAQIDLRARLHQGQFLTLPELTRLAEAAQYRLADLADDEVESVKPQVINLHSVRRRLKSQTPETQPVDVATQASRIRYAAAYLEFLSGYFGADLPKEQRAQLKESTDIGMRALLSNMPMVSRRDKPGARHGLSPEDQNRVLAAIDPDSPINPWKRGFVRHRNWLIVVLLLATGMRRGELLGLQIGDLSPNSPKLTIVRRADSASDARMTQQVAKTNARELELRPALMRAVWEYIKVRRSIKAARRIPQLIISDEGEALSAQSITKLFADLRRACPGLPVNLTSHVMRHTWNERFSEQAEHMQLSDSVEERARNEQQGWADDSKMSKTYTRRHAQAKGRQVALKLQEALDAPEK